MSSIQKPLSTCLTQFTHFSIIPRSIFFNQNQTYTPKIQMHTIKQKPSIDQWSKHTTTLTIRRPMKKTSRSSRRAHFNCASFVRGGQVSSSSSVTASLARSSFVLMTDHNSSIPGPDVDIGAEFLCRRRRGQQIHNVAVVCVWWFFLQCVELIRVCVVCWGCVFSQWCLCKRGNSEIGMYHGGL